MLSKIFDTAALAAFIFVVAIWLPTILEWYSYG